MNFTKLVILTNMPSPYQVEFFNAIKEKIDLEVIYARKTLKTRKWNFEKYIEHRHIFLKGNLKERLTKMKELLTGSTETTVFIVSGYNLPEFLYAIKILNSRHMPWLFWGEKIRLQNFTVKKLTILSLIKKARAVLAMGEQAASIYYEILKMPVYILPYHIDTQKFEERTSYFHNGKVNFLYSGQMIKRKGVHVLEKAVLSLDKPYLEKTFFHFIGDGESLSALKEALRALENVKFYGFVKYENLSALYKMGDVFLFPSLYDGWGVALTEGMAAGMLPVSTYTTGAAVQNILHGINGYIIPPDNPKELATLLKYLVDNKEIIPHMGKKAREYAVKYNDVRKGTDKLLNILNSI